MPPSGRIATNEMKMRKEGRTEERKKEVFVCFEVVTSILLKGLKICQI
jgi:hypothetical protein